MIIVSFDIRMESRASSLKVKTEWHVAFHGTREDCVKPILECGHLLIPGNAAEKILQSFTFTIVFLFFFLTKTCQIRENDLVVELY